MRSHWTNLSEREQLMVALAAALLIVYLFYLLVYSPLQQAIHLKSLEWQEKRETLALMRFAQKERLGQKKQLNLTNTKLMALMGDELSHNRLHAFPYQLQQRGNAEVQLSFKAVPLNFFLSWLWNFTRHYNLSLQQFIAAPVQRPGLAKITVMLKP